MGYLSPARERLKHTRSRVQPASVSVEDAAHVPSDEDKKLLADLTAEVRKRQLSSSENFDKSILTLSSGGLAVSLGFLKDFLPIDQSAWSWTLYTSWFALTMATVVTMLSFLASARAQEYQQSAAQAYYLEQDSSKLGGNPWDKVVIWMNRAAGVGFISGVILTTLFVSINLERAHAMKSSRQGTTQSPTAMQTMQSPSDRRGLTSPGIVPSTPARPPSAPAPAPSPQNPPLKK